MFRNYLTIALRNLRKHRFTSFINLFGLTVGFTCCWLIAAYILHETSYDTYNSKASRTYRVARTFNNPDGVVTLKLSAVAPPFGPLLQNYFPDIEKATRLLPNGRTPVKSGEKIFNENNVFFADENFFSVFDVKTTKGNPASALSDPYTVMLSEPLARKYFGDADPMNQMIRINNIINLKISGVFQPLPENAHIHPEMMVSFNTLKDSAIYGERQLETNFGNNAFYTYLLFPDNYPVEKIEAQLPAFLDARVHFPGAPATFKPSTITKLFLQKLTDIHLRSHLDDEAEENGDIKRVYIFSAIALIILLIACINYMNLSTARSTLRAKEIGIRKVAGATKTELITQFLSESILLTWIAMLLAFTAAWAILPLLNSIAGIQLSITSVTQWQWFPLAVLVPFIVGTLAGIYPALFLSSFQPAKTLKGLFRVGGKSISLRKALVVVQFGISIVLIVTTVVVFQQLKYMQDTALGYNKDHVLILPNYFNTDVQYEAFRASLATQSGIQTIGRSSRIPSGRLLDSQNAAAESGDSLRPVTSELKALAADYDFLTCYDIKMAAGRNFSRAFTTDTTGFILNETAVKVLGWNSADKAVGRNFQYGNVKGKIIGVAKDFHFESLHQRIAPMVLAMPKPEQANFFNWMSIKLTGDPRQLLPKIEDALRKLQPELPFTYSFQDDNFRKLYISEQRQSKLFTLFACIAIFVACLGLLGLSSFAISQRIKEIGIRKVLGAGTSSIVMLLSADFMKLVIIAALIAFPVAWYGMHSWLSDFAYRISIQWWVFLVAGLMAAAVALITVSLLAMKAATANPVKSLRTE
jgi:putative ABC transport system permease protein